jgi:MerR HTH family regulatory protein
MKTNSLIRIEQVCIHCKVEVSFIQSLHELGHIELIDESNDHYISEEQLKSLESLIFFHTELQINIEGIDTIAHLLKKIENLQNELIVAKNKLGLSPGA